MKKFEISLLKDKIKLNYLNTEIAEIAFYLGKEKTLLFQEDKKQQNRILTIRGSSGVEVHIAVEDLEGDLLFSSGLLCL